MTSFFFQDFQELANLCFIYIALAKHCWITKLREFKSGQKYLARQIRESWKPKKIIANFESFSTNVPIIGENLPRTFYRLFYLQFCASSDQWKKHCVAKVLLATWEILLHENNRNYNSYRFSYNLAFLLVLSFPTNQKQESGFHKVSGLVTINISFCF